MLQWLVLFIILAAAAMLRYGLLDIPLERDEGEYAYAGQLILQGTPPYQKLYNMKLPGVYAAYALILSIFGQTHTGVHLGLLFVNAVTIVLVFLLGRRLDSSFAGLSAAGVFAVLSVVPKTQGVFANTEHFVILFAVAGLFLLLKSLDNSSSLCLFLSGVLIGTGFLMKQHGVVFVLFGLIWICIDQIYNRSISWQSLVLKFALFSFGAAVPYGLICLFLYCAGVFKNFWFWTVEYALAYTSQVPAEHAWLILKNMAVLVFGAAPLIWTLAGFGLTVIVWGRKTRKQYLFVLLFAVFSFFAICPGFYFRAHYFILLIPAAALLAGITVSAMADLLSIPRLWRIRFFLSVIVVVACLLLTLFQHRNFLFKMTPVQASRHIYGLSPFPESIEIGKFIKEHTKDDDRIAVIGSEPQIYFYSNRRSASGYIYMYPLMESHDFAEQMQEEMIREIESAHPKFLVCVQVDSSWMSGPDSSNLLFEWTKNFQAKHYTLVGLVDLLEDGTLYHWAPDIKWPPSSSLWIALFKRND